MPSDRINEHQTPLLSRAIDQAEHLSRRVVDLVGDNRITVFTICAVGSALLFVIVCLWMLYSGFLDKTL